MNDGDKHQKKNLEPKWYSRKFNLLGVHIRRKRGKGESQHLGRITLDSVDFDKLEKLWKANGTDIQ